MSTDAFALTSRPGDFYHNPFWRPDRPYDAVAATLRPDEMDQAAEVIGSWSEYRPTPLRSLAGLARQLGLGAILCKDESGRFGLGGVKALGAPYGLQVLLREKATVAAGPRTAIAATDGNHGLALAWAAGRCGCLSLIFVGRDVDAGRLSRIRATGAAIEIVDGTYDDAVEAAERRAAADPAALLITDTDYTGALPVCRAIMAGYALLAAEAWRDGLAGQPPTHVFLHCGVGTMAAGITAGLWRHLTPATPRVITVEPIAAACLLASLRAGRPVQVEGALATRMAGLACGRPSLPAWTVLSKAAFAGMTVGEDTAVAVQEGLANGAYGDPPLAGGDTGIAGLAGLVAAAADPEARGRLNLGPDSRVFVVNSEGPLPVPAG
ncbi:diaminopropionate ammonia-lyase [Shumkonia mesophila]|uniref:diaminopropionate ammonia-lyase n=1 Tax=Shumkonia mesophila TaxID=2838854 RepID=UPI002935186A|nr:diaminopropionate ammonia-lyase [Shumkonia mesophila]